jgi:hypothetical protein
MMRLVYALILLAFITSCKDSTSDVEDQKVENKSQFKQAEDNQNSENPIINGEDASQEDTTIAPASFTDKGFDQAIKYELLLETHICNPNYTDSVSDNSVPCSAKFFRFFEYNHKRSLEDAFMLQVKAGVNGYPYRRLLIFTRERGKLVLVNGITGYLVSNIKRPNEIDDLVVGVVDDLGNSNFDRYDVLLRYKDGKYHVIEALGDLQGKFTDQKLKEKATKMIKQRIEEKDLIF